MVKKSDKINKAKKEIKEAQDAVFDVAEDSCDCEHCGSKDCLTRAARDLERAEAEVEEFEEED
ncbi:MAG: hypothetical protein WCX73_02030 [Candidatus Pacearchaeota archaeon]|jgi:hypothetical protein